MQQHKFSNVLLYVCVCVCVGVSFCKCTTTLLAVTRIKAFHFSTLFKGAAAPVFHFTCCRILHLYLSTAKATPTTTAKATAAAQCIKEICYINNSRENKQSKKQQQHTLFMRLTIVRSKCCIIISKQMQDTGCMCVCLWVLRKCKQLTVSIPKARDHTASVYHCRIDDSVRSELCLDV